MIRRSMTVLALAACTFAPLASFAATSSASEDNANVAAKGPMVHVTLKNKSNSEQTLTIQGKQMVLGVNESKAVTVPAGTQVLGADNQVKLTVVKEYNNATASFNN